MTGGSYSYASNGRGCLTLEIATAPAAAAKRLAIAGKSNRKHAHGRKKATRRPHGSAVATDITTFSFALGQTNKSGRIEPFDLDPFDIDLTSLVAAAGNIHVQTPGDFSLNKLATHFAFGAAGWFTDSEFIDRTGIAGTATNTNGTLSNSFADTNIDGDPSGRIVRRKRLARPGIRNNRSRRGKLHDSERRRSLHVQFRLLRREPE